MQRRNGWQVRVGSGKWKWREEVDAKLDMQMVSGEKKCGAASGKWRGEVDAKIELAVVNGEMMMVSSCCEL